MKHLYKKDIFPNIIVFVTLIISAWGFLWSLFEYGLTDLRYFTNLSNLFVFVTVFLLFINRHDKKWFKYLAVITLVNITMTGVIYHVMLATPPLAFQSHLTHTLTPILYVIFYFTCIDDAIKLRQFWISLVFPLIYFLFFIITGPSTGFYPYGFMNVAENGIGEVMKFVGLILVPAIAVISIFFIFIKSLGLKKIKG